MIRVLTTALWTAGACTLALAQAGPAESRRPAPMPPLPVAPFVGVPVVAGLAPQGVPTPSAAVAPLAPVPAVASSIGLAAAPAPAAPAATSTLQAASLADTMDQRWEVRAGDVTLAKTFERWALAAGHKLKWDASRNFLIGAPDVYVGTFEGALQHVLHSPGIRFSDYPLEACVYANTPPLVRVTRQGEQVRECAAVNAP